MSSTSSNTTAAAAAPIITCKAAVIWKENESPKVEEIQVEGPKSGEVRVRMLFASICHTDVLGCKGFPTYTVVDANYLVKIDPNIPLPHASFLSCGFTTGFGAVWKEAKVHRGSTVAVLGLGAVGLGGIGKMMMLGAATDKSVEIDFVTLLSCRTFKYAVFGGVKVQSDLPIVIHKCINKEIQNLDSLLTHQVALEDINTAFQLLKEPQCVKVVINLCQPTCDKDFADGRFKLKLKLNQNEYHALQFP
ncbi:UNVERIFIED_CONTAM: CYP enzymes assisting alcohol dehydrogenase [Sesamum radiatum]|uniref:CYP enzymes assisting alcohol dehydrogenase n=1 Tax=Sesamum radiatum TaxID=300843 RepID=A0AAW2KCE7_SESRA